MFTYRQGKAAGLRAGARRSRRSVLLGWRATSYALALKRGSPSSPYSERRDPHVPGDSTWASQCRGLLRSMFTAARESLRPPKHSCAGREVGGMGSGAGQGPAGERRILERLRGPPGADSAAEPGEAAGRRPRASEEARSPARGRPAGLGRAPSAEGPRGRGRGPGTAGWAHP